MKRKGNHIKGGLRDIVVGDTLISYVSNMLKVDI